jgi:hypothetical protein
LVALNHFTIPVATFRSSLEKAIVAVERRNDGWASKTRRREPAPSPLLVRMNPLIWRDLARLGQLDHVHRRRVAASLARRRNVNLLTSVRRDLSY